MRIYQETQSLAEFPNCANVKKLANAAHPYRLRVGAWREHLGLTQAEVAARAGLTQAALSQIESGEHKPRKATQAKIAAALGITVEQMA